MTSTLTAPRVLQVAPAPAEALAALVAGGSVGEPIKVKAHRNADRSLTLTLDPGTAATLLDYLRAQATEQEAIARTTADNEHIRADRREWMTAYEAIRAHRLRTVIDAEAAEQARLYGPAVTYDVD
jgi:hypothetical protein